MRGSRGRACQMHDASKFIQPTLFPKIPYLQTSVTEFRYTAYIESLSASFDWNDLEKKIDYHFHTGGAIFSDETIVSLFAHVAITWIP